MSQYSMCRVCRIHYIFSSDLLHQVDFNVYNEYNRICVLSSNSGYIKGQQFFLVTNLISVRKAGLNKK